MHMIGILNASGHTTYGLKEFVIDTVDDIENLPIDVPQGSVAFCIATSSVYMINGSREWVEI